MRLLPMARRTARHWVLTATGRPRAVLVTVVLRVAHRSTRRCVVCMSTLAMVVIIIIIIYRCNPPSMRPMGNTLEDMWGLEENAAAPC